MYLAKITRKSANTTQKELEIFTDRQAKQLLLNRVSELIFS